MAGAKKQAGKHILYTWELGENFGHMSAFVDVARALVKAGHKVTVALQDISRADQFFDAKTIDVLQAPLVPKNPAMYKRINTLTFADLVRNFGYMEPERLANALRAWRNMYQLVQPDMVIFNASPTAQLAMRGLGIKRASLDTGFAIPPLTAPLPSLRPWEKIPLEHIITREKEVLGNINRAMGILKLPPLRSMAELFVGNRELLCTFREIDHYGWIRPEKTTYLGASFVVDNGLQAQWPAEGGKRRIFAYLQPKNPQSIHAINALLNYPDCKVILVAPGLKPEVIAKIRRPNVAIYTQQVQIQPLLMNLDFAVTHGGHGTAAACMLAGVPMVVIPNHLEQMLVARNLLKAGIAVMPKPSVKEPNYTRMFDELLTQPVYQKNAKALADKYKSFTKPAQVKALVRMIEEELFRVVTVKPVVKDPKSKISEVKKTQKPAASKTSAKKPVKKAVKPVKLVKGKKK